MSVAEQSLAEFQVVLDRHRANEAAYKDRLKEINLTRGKIADQLEALQQTYDKKLRGLEQKLEVLRGQNDSLVRENTLYRSEIETYQSRLLEKEKIIAALLAQRRDLPVVASSDKSKSEKTDSLNANEEESKAFKKQPVFKQDYEHPVSTTEKFKQDPTVERLANHADPPARQKVEKASDKPQHEVKPPPQKTVPLPVLPQVVNQAPPSPLIEKPIQKPIEQANQVEFVVSSVPPRTRPGKPTKQPKKKPLPVPAKTKYVLHQKAKPLDANNFFSSLGKQEVPQQVEVCEEQEEKVAHAGHHFEQEQIIVAAQAEPELIPEQEAHYPQQEEEVINYAPQFEAEQEQLQFEPQQYHQEEPEYHHEEPKYHQISPSKDDHEEEEQTYNHELQQEQGNFLSHFNQPETEAENYYQPYPLKKKPKAKRPKAASGEVVVQTVEQEATGSDFFAQLSRAEHEPHQLDNIEESSIDHIDRDNSLLSNEQPYFAVEAETAPKRAVKMSKKKKRDQIKMMDPSCFD